VPKGGGGFHPVIEVRPKGSDQVTAVVEGPTCFGGCLDLCTDTFFVRGSLSLRPHPSLFPLFFSFIPFLRRHCVNTMDRPAYNSKIFPAPVAAPVLLVLFRRWLVLGFLMTAVVTTVAVMTAVVIVALTYLPMLAACFFLAN